MASRTDALGGMSGEASGDSRVGTLQRRNILFGFVKVCLYCV